MEAHFHIEKPSEKDLFHGKSHEHVATVIADTLQEKSDIKLLGIEGQLGAGKSTVINLTKAKLPTESYFFVDFDAELHHEDSSKRSLITVLHDSLYPLVSASRRKDFTDHKDKALGNTLSYNKKQKSKLSWWTVSFIVSVLFSSQVMRSLFSEIREGIDFSSMDNFSLFALGLQVLFFLSPAITLLSFWKFGGSGQTFGDIVKRNSDDTINETILVSREVGILELRKALTGFLECIPEGKTVVLVFDNLDRVAVEKVKDAWSEIELIASLPNKNFRVLLPYSEKHVAVALVGGDGDVSEGVEFISKRIPVSYRVPPIVSAGWKDAFSEFWKETFNTHDSEEEARVAELLEIWLPPSHTQITPRLLKRLINDIQAVMLVVPTKVSTAVAAYYILSNRYANLPIEHLLSEPREDGEAADENERLLARKIQASNSKLKRYFNSLSDEWQRELLCIHYQTTPEIAECELIEQPLKHALNTRDIEDYLSLSKLYGFSGIQSKLIEEGGYAEWVRLLAELIEEECLTEAKFLVPKVSKLLNSEFCVNGTEPYDKATTEALATVIEADIGLDQTPLDRQYSELKAEFRRINRGFKPQLDSGEDRDSKQDAQIRNTLEELDQYCGMLKTKALNPGKLSGGLFVEYLLPNARSYKNLQIDSLILDPINTSEAFRCVFALQKSEWLQRVSDLSRMNKVGQTALSKAVSEGQFDSHGSVDVFTNGNQPFTMNDSTSWVLASLPLQSRWHTEVLVDRYVRNLPHSGEYSAEMKAQAVVQLIASDNTNHFGNLSPHLGEPSGFQDYLIEYLPYLSNSYLLFDAFQNNEIAELIRDSICELIDQQRIATIHPSGLITSGYAILREHIDLQRLQSWLSSHATSIRESLHEASLQELSEVFVEDILSSALELPEVREGLLHRVIEFDGSEDEWQEFITTPSISQTLIAQQMIKENLKLKNDKSASGFLMDFYEFNTDFLGLQKIKFVDFVYHLLSGFEQSRLIGKLNDLVHQRDFDTNKQLAIIRDFGELIKLDMSSSFQGKRPAIRLLEEAASLPFLPAWLRKQSFSFPDWSEEDVKSAAEAIGSFEGEELSELANDKIIRQYLPDEEPADNEPDESESVEAN